MTTTPGFISTLNLRAEINFSKLNKLMHLLAEKTHEITTSSLQAFFVIARLSEETRHYYFIFTSFSMIAGSSEIIQNYYFIFKSFFVIARLSNKHIPKLFFIITFPDE